VAVSAAQELNQQMLRGKTCHVPQPRYLKVSELQPSTSRSYTPNCVVLHRCAEDTGCCLPNYVCSPKTTHQATVYIYVSSQFYIDFLMHHQAKQFFFIFDDCYKERFYVFFYNFF
jgi:hypothetical protein